jgi:hypothetical protein
MEPADRMLDQQDKDDKLLYDKCICVDCLETFDAEFMPSTIPLIRGFDKCPDHCPKCGSDKVIFAKAMHNESDDDYVTWYTDIGDEYTDFDKEDDYLDDE